MVINQILSTFRFTDKTTNTPIINGDVYFNGELIAKSIILASENPSALNVTNNPSEVVIYKTAEIPPSKKFILMNSDGWENERVEIYEISTKRIYKVVTTTGHNYGSWLTDGRLKVRAESGMTVLPCGIFESASSTEPWIVKRVADC